MRCPVTKEKCQLYKSPEVDLCNMCGLIDVNDVKLAYAKPRSKGRNGLMGCPARLLSVGDSTMDQENNPVK